MNRVILLLASLALSACSPLVQNDIQNVDGIDVYVFEDAESGERVTDVFDLNRDIVRFATTNEMLFTSEGLAFEGWSARGERLVGSGDFQIRFGKEDGEVRAYFTEGRAATLCDIRVFDDALDIVSSDEFVPFEE